jgi:hypothetical protein
VTVLPITVLSAAVALPMKVGEKEIAEACLAGTMYRTRVPLKSTDRPTGFKASWMYCWWLAALRPRW